MAALTSRMPWYLSRLLYHESLSMTLGDLRGITFAEVVEINAHLDVMDRETLRVRQDMEKQRSKSR